EEPSGRLDAARPATSGKSDAAGRGGRCVATRAHPLFHAAFRRPPGSAGRCGGRAAATPAFDPRYPSRQLIPVVFLPCSHYITGCCTETDAVSETDERKTLVLTGASRGIGHATVK